MSRRFLAIMMALTFWCAGGLLLSGSAAFLFAAMLHQFGTDGWFTSTLGAIGLAGSGSFIVGVGCWLASRVWYPPRRELLASDDAMWLI